ncbi:MAG: hypothetical protein HN509_14850 [Halobacteriovoraceae bacterium]|jgi:hypothetical protein|nr:hypothetical protein [Halobacteriovoraceae bacterium]MBT5095082.1 hypothetical protein [Halobacteriovoraceae bacterium]
MTASRLEVNKQVRTILCRHNADLQQLNFSFVGSTVNLDGILLKVGGGDYSATQIESMVSDIRRIPAVSSISSNLLNWCLAGGSITRLVSKRLNKSEYGYDQDEEDSDQYFDDDDFDDEGEVA